MSEIKLNKIERLKAKKKASSYRFELTSIDWHNLDEENRFYLKNFGIYNIKLRPESFMIRIRIDAGRIAFDSLERIAEIVEAYSLKIIITSRAQMEIHGMMADNVYAIYLRLQKEEIETAQTLTDNFRAIVTDPYDGLSEDSTVECYPMIRKIRQMILNNPVWMGTIPRKFNTALIGRETPLVNVWGNDLLFALAEKAGKYGFNVYLGGKNSEVAKTADIFVLPHEVLGLFEAVALTYHAHGLRGSRSKTRLFHLLEKVGMIQVREWLEEICGQKLENAGILKMQSSLYSAETALKNSASGSIRFTRYGESSAEELKEILALVKGSQAEIRLGIDQNFHLVPTLNTTFTRAENAILLTACAGSRYCPLSLWDIKADISELPTDDSKKYGISLGFSGCLKGCGRHYHTDIGLIGLRTNLFGETEKAFRIFLGATQSPVAVPSRMLYYSVPLRCSDGLFSVLFEDFEASGCTLFSDFSHTVLNGCDIEFLQLWYLFRQAYRKESRKLLILFLKTENNIKSDVLFDKIKTCTKDKEIVEYRDLTRILSYQVWDQ